MILKNICKIDSPESSEELLKLLQNMNLAGKEGTLNLAGVLLFAEKPEWLKPEFIVKAVSYPGNTVSVSEYLDSEDFCGPLKKVFDDSLAFIMRNLKKVQAGQNVNAPGVPEILSLHLLLQKIYCLIGDWEVKKISKNNSNRWKIEIYRNCFSGFFDDKK